MEIFKKSIFSKNPNFALLSREPRGVTRLELRKWAGNSADAEFPAHFRSSSRVTPSGVCTKAENLNFASCPEAHHTSPPRAASPLGCCPIQGVWKNNYYFFQIGQKLDPGKIVGPEKLFWMPKNAKQFLFQKPRSWMLEIVSG